MALLRMPILLWAVLVAAPGGSAFAGEPARRETNLRYEVDASFQASGGLQFFYELAKDDPSPEKSSASFALFRTLDTADRWSSLSAPTHVLMSRLTYTVDRDVSFFSEAQVSDVAYINAVATEMGVTKEADGSFRVRKTPANTFRITYFDAAQVQAEQRTAVLVRLQDLSGEAVLPSSVVIQENTDFARVMGMRTAEFGVTVTGHYALGPGRTRVQVLSLSYLHTLPPFFLGGEKRVYRESLNNVLSLIRNLRAFKTTTQAP